MDFSYIKMEDLNLSESTGFNDADLFTSFFFNDNGDQQEDKSLIHDTALLSVASSPIESTADNAESSSSSPMLSPLPTPSLPTSELELFDIPSLFPSLDNLKLESAEEEEEVLQSSTISPADLHAQSTCAETTTTTTTTTKSRASKKRVHPPTPTATTRKRAVRQPAKKQKVSPVEPKAEPVDFVSSLKGLTSVELERIPEHRDLTVREQEELKKYIRMIKNRESAQLSRERRKVYQDTLEQSFNEETDRHAKLKQQILELEAENKILKGEFLHFKSLIDRSNLGQAFSSFAENNTLQTMTKSAAAGDLRAQATFAMYLLIVLHSFGQQLHPFAPMAKDTTALLPPAVEAKA